MAIQPQPLAPDDLVVLEALNEVVPSRRTRWLTEKLIAGLLKRNPDPDLSEIRVQDSEPAAVTKVVEDQHGAERPEVSAKDVDEVPAPAEQTESGRPNLAFLKELFK